MTTNPTQQLQPLSLQPMHPALLPIVVAMANYHEGVWRAAKAGNVPPEQAGAEQAKALLDAIGSELEKAAAPAPAAPAQWDKMRIDRHLIRSAIALVARAELAEVAGQSRAAIAQQLQVMLAESWSAEPVPELESLETGEGDATA